MKLKKERRQKVLGYMPHVYLDYFQGLINCPFHRGAPNGIHHQGSACVFPNAKRMCQAPRVGQVHRREVTLLWCLLGDWRRTFLSLQWWDASPSGDPRCRRSPDSDAAWRSNRSLLQALRESVWKRKTAVSGGQQIWLPF